MSRHIPSTVTANFSNTVIVSGTGVSPITAYTFKVSLRGPSTQDITGTVTGDSITFDMLIPVAGMYRYTLLAIDTNQIRTLIESGDLVVTPDPTAIEDGQDLRSHAKKVLDAIEAVLEKRATKDQESHTIAGRSLSRTPIADLLMLRDRYRAELHTATKKLPKNVLFKFGSR